MRLLLIVTGSFWYGFVQNLSRAPGNGVIDRQNEYVSLSYMFATFWRNSPDQLSPLSMFAIVVGSIGAL